MCEFVWYRNGCRCSCSFVPVLGILLWLFLTNTRPNCSIQDFYLPALNKTANSTSNTTIYFNLKLRNRNVDKGIYYDALNLTFYYGLNRSHPIGNATFPGFYQGHNKGTERGELLETYGVPWDAVLREVSNGTAVFRVDLAAALRFKTVFGSTSRTKKLMVGSMVEVNDSGEKVKKKGIKLKSGAPGLDCYRVRTTLLVAFGVFILMFI